MTTATKTALTNRKSLHGSTSLLRKKNGCIQDELFADNVRSTDPPNSPYLSMRKVKLLSQKGEDFLKKVWTFMELLQRTRYSR